MRWLSDRDDLKSRSALRRIDASDVYLNSPRSVCANS